MDNKTTYFELVNGSMLEGYPVVDPAPLERQAELREQIHAGEITDKEYPKTFHSIKTAHKGADYAAQNNEMVELSKIFGNDARLLFF